MRALLALLLIPASFFVGSLFTMWVSDLIVSPYGLAGYTYQQAMGINAVVDLALIVTYLFVLTIGLLFD